MLQTAERSRSQRPRNAKAGVIEGLDQDRHHQDTDDILDKNTIVVPSMLVERQDDLRRLVVNLNTMPWDGHYNRELNKSIKSMPVLGEDFPNLKVFVLSIYFHCSVSEAREYKARFQTDVLKMRNFRQDRSGLGWEYVSIEHTSIELIATLARWGPEFAPWFASVTCSTEPFATSVHWFKSETHRLVCPGRLLLAMPSTRSVSRKILRSQMQETSSLELITPLGTLDSVTIEGRFIILRIV